MNLFFDLDGTLIDSKRRLYDLFIDLTKIEISFDEYWRLKRNMISNEDILSDNNFSSERIAFFRDQWMSNIETEQYLDKDVAFEFTHQVLEKLKGKGAKLFVITARQSKESAVWQLKKLNLDTYFEHALVTEHKLEKTDLIKKYNLDLSENDFFIGDTGLDVKTGKDLGIKTVAVLSGFRNKEKLMSYNPDYICNDILDFIEVADI